MIGTFFQPKAVFIDPQTLVSLSKRDFLAGYAEVVKYGLINDKNFFLWLNKNGKKEGGFLIERPNRLFS